jgi:HD-GYP domain-containing protein (c-di-GMP phosphodiesterase class II)
VKSGSADHLTISSTIVHRALENAEAVLTRDAADDSRFSARGSIIAQNIASAMCAPLCHHGETLGVVYVDTRGTTNAFSEEDRELLVALTGPAAIAIRNAQYLRKLEQAYQDTLVMTANAIEARDHYTVGHTWRVTHFATEIARALGWSDERIRECEMGGVLHDVGKIAIDDAILRKPSQLTDEEYAKMKVHPERGARMMRDVESLVALIPYALYHHERYDGKGYPFQLAGDDIPIEGRIVAVADTFDAMTSNRPYRKGLDAEVALKEIVDKAGSQFDPAVVEAFRTCYQEGRIERIQQEYYKGDRSVICPFCSTHIRIPEDAAAGTEFQCGVCHRRNRLQIRNEAYFAELIPEAESPSPSPSSDPPQT